MSSTRDRLIERIRKDLAVVELELDPRNPGPATLKLREWLAGWPTETQGAAPSTTRAKPRDPNAPLDDGPLVPVDPASRSLEELGAIFDDLRRIADDHLGVIGRTDPLLLPTRAERLRWALCGKGAESLPLPRLKRAARRLARAVVIVETTQPAQPNRSGETCHAHEAAGDPHEPTAPEYRHLCRWCGRFKAMHGVHPPPEIVKRHSRGARITHADLRRAGIKRAG